MINRIAAQLVLMLLCLPACASPHVKVDGQDYVPLVRVEQMITDATSDYQNKLTLLERHIAAGPIYTQCMKGSSFDERLGLAYATAPEWTGQRIVVWETGWQSIEGTVDRPALTGLIDEVTYTPLFWSESVPDYYDAPMIRAPASWRSPMRGLHLIGRKIESQTDVRGDAGLEIVPDYQNDNNTARNLPYDLLRIAKFDRGVIIGDYSAPDLTEIAISNSAFSGCATGAQVVGGNVIVKIADTAFTGRNMKSAVHVIYSGQRYFDGVTKPQYVDVREKHRAWDWCPTKSWLSRIIDAERRNALNPSFDSTTASTWGGGPDVKILDCNISFGGNSELGDRYAIRSDGCKFEMVGIRVEGKAGVAKINSIYGNPNMHDKRFECLVRDVHTVDKRVDPFSVERKKHNAGFALRIEGGYFANPTLPEQSNDPELGIVEWDGPRGPEGVLR